MPGLGGNATTPGQPGTFLGDPLPIPDGEDGVLCDPEGDGCDEDDPDPEDPEVCTEGLFTIDSFYTKRVGENSTTITLTIVGAVSADGWTYSEATYSRTDVIDGQTNQGSREATEGEVVGLVESASLPYCGESPVVQWADQGGLVLECEDCTYTIVVYGCNPYGIGLEDRDRYACCPRPSSDGYYVSDAPPDPQNPGERSWQLAGTGQSESIR